MDWLGKMLQLPSEFLSGGKGGGIIQVSIVTISNLCSETNGVKSALLSRVPQVSCGGLLFTRGQLINWKPSPL